jgi:formylglycine-generating enzyme required for sulfatase activity
MKKWLLLLILTGIVIVTGLVVSRQLRQTNAEKSHFRREETELIVTNLAGATTQLFKAGQTPREATPVAGFDGQRIWLPRGDYFLEAKFSDRSVFYPVPLNGYRSGPDSDGALIVTIRQPPAENPPRLLSELPQFIFIPSGSFLFGDRLNPREPHYVWLPAFFISPGEVTNAEFREFLSDPQGYASQINWTQSGQQWKAANASQSSALLKPADADFTRFGQPDQPVTHVTWFEAQAYGRWLTRKLGAGRWLFALPSEAEWEKAARGPDNFDYSLSRALSDQEVKVYNWKKNPAAPVTVVGLRETLANYQANRYGLYHLTGNVAEWTASINQPFSREHPYVDTERNREELSDARIVRGGSWYSASAAWLYISWHGYFQPAVSHHDLGFRIVARPLPITTGTRHEFHENDGAGISDDRRAKLTE